MPRRRSSWAGSVVESGAMKSAESSGVFATVLGNMQDAGLPQAGCRCRRCARAYEDPRAAAYAACLALVDWRQTPPAVWLVDATPDIKYQLNFLADSLGLASENRLRPPTAVLLTHAHMGHVSGLMHLGPEAMAVHDLPVYASAALVEALRQSPVWQSLLARLRLLSFSAGEPLALAEGLTVTPLPVPHRDELGTGTFAFLVEGPSRRLLYLPDIDSWSGWPAARRHIEGVDVALVDATFASADEIERQAAVAHPPLKETLAFFADWPGELWLTHLNHTNPLLDPDSDAARAVATAGSAVVRMGQTFAL